MYRESGSVSLYLYGPTNIVRCCNIWHWRWYSTIMADVWQAIVLCHLNFENPPNTIISGSECGILPSWPTSDRSLPSATLVLKTHSTLSSLIISGSKCGIPQLWPMSDKLLPCATLILKLNQHCLTLQPPVANVVFHHHGRCLTGHCLVPP